MSEKKKATPKETAIGCLVLVGAALVFVKFCAKPVPKELQAKVDALSAAPRPAPVPSACVLSVPGHPESPVLMFPTEEGDDAYIDAARRHAGDAELLAVQMRHRAFTVMRGTTCEVDDLGLDRSRVKVTSGPHAGERGFVPNAWRRGE